MGKGIRHINTTSECFVDTKTRQLLVDYSFLVLVPGSLQLNLSFIVSNDWVARTFPGRKTSTVVGNLVLHSSGGNNSAEVVSGGAGSTISGTSEGRNGILAQISRRGSSSSPFVSSSSSTGMVSRGMLTRTFFDFCGGAVMVGVGAGSVVTRLLTPGPPSTALGGPPVLTLGALRLRGWNCGVGAGINIGGIPWGNWPGRSGVRGTPIGGGIPAAAN